MVPDKHASYTLKKVSKCNYFCFWSLSSGQKLAFVSALMLIIQESKCQCSRVCVKIGAPGKDWENITVQTEVEEI